MVEVIVKMIHDWIGAIVVGLLLGLGGAIWYASQAWERLKNVEARVEENSAILQANADALKTNAEALAYIRGRIDSVLAAEAQ